MLMKAVALCTGDTITRDLLPDFLFYTEASKNNRRPEAIPADEQSLQDIEKAHIARVLESTNWHRGRTCEILGVSRPRLRRLMSQYGLESPRHNIRELDDWNGG